MFYVEVDDDNVECDNKSRLSGMDDERYQQEEDDANTLDNLEWELASKTGKFSAYLQSAYLFTHNNQVIRK